MAETYKKITDGDGKDFIEVIETEIREETKENLLLRKASLEASLKEIDLKLALL